MVLFMEGDPLLKICRCCGAGYLQHRGPASCRKIFPAIPVNTWRKTPGGRCVRPRGKGRINSYSAIFSARARNWKRRIEKERKREIESRYFQGSVVSAAFEIFEEAGSFQEAMELLLEVVGLRYRLDRITVIRTDIREKNGGRMYQWLGSGVSEALTAPEGFSKEDF